MDRTVTLADAMQAAGTAVYLDRQKCEEQFGRGLFDKAVAFHQSKNLRADLKNGTVRNTDGWQSGFVDYDWGHVYEEAPHHVWHDFLRGFVINSASRMARGLKP